MILTNIRSVKTDHQRQTPGGCGLSHKGPPKTVHHRGVLLPRATLNQPAVIASGDGHRPQVRIGAKLFRGEIDYDGAARNGRNESERPSNVAGSSLGTG
jgi:hypothetical protein